MKTVILGWYGTETIGDRTILAGIIHLLAKASKESVDILLGSLYPDFSGRTLLEDSDFYRFCANHEPLNIEIFNSYRKKELRNAIKSGDVIIVGGGPLMDIPQMEMLEYAFKYAKKLHKPTCLFGCGWGPLNERKYIDIAKELINSSDKVIFRDTTSLQQAKVAFGKDSPRIPKMKSIVDPAAITALAYKNCLMDLKPTNDYIAVNFRDISLDKYDGNADAYCSYFKDTLDEIKNSSDIPVHLIPMHTYFIGGDDRILLNRLAMNLNKNELIVHNIPMSLQQTMDFYYNAKVCIGMRFHSVVLQTLLNGKNYILDYTNPTNGKTIGFLKELDLVDQTKNRYISLLSEPRRLSIDYDITPVTLPDNCLDEWCDKYLSEIKSIL